MPPTTLNSEEPLKGPAGPHTGGAFSRPVPVAAAPGGERIRPAASASARRSAAQRTTPSSRLAQPSGTPPIH